MKPAACLATALLLAACSRGESEEKPVPADTSEAIALGEPSAEQRALLEAEDCRAVAEAYVAAINRGDFAFAARFWPDVAGAFAGLEHVFSDYREPRIAISRVMEGNGAMPLCTVTAALSDAADESVPLRQDTMTFERAEDPALAGDGHSRWQLDRHTFIEPMDRAGAGEPA